MLKSIFRFFFGNNSSQINIREIIADTSNTILLDVRTAGEYQQYCAKNSVNIDVKNMTQKKEYFLKNKDKNFVVFCASGMRSYQAVSHLKKLGLSKVYNAKTVHRIKSMQ